jgi:long-chain acyl-CoA synthetase
MEKIWRSNYPPGVKFEINPHDYASLIPLIEESCHRFGDQIAFENLRTTITYRQLWAKSAQLAAYLQQKLHLHKGDRFAIMLPNVLQYPIAIIAALRLGLVIVNINPLYTERELLEPLQDSGAKAIFVLANFTQHLSKILGQTKVEHVIVTELGDEFVTGKRWMINAYLKYVKRRVPKITMPHLNYLTIMTKNRLPLNPVVITASDLAFLQYTGGTTGGIKGAMLTHGNLVANLLQCTSWIDGALQEGSEVVVTALPLYHIFSLTICFFCFIKLGGRSLLVTNPRDIPGFIKELKRQPFSVFVGVNTLFQELLRSPLLSTVNFKDVKLTLAGGMPVTHAVANSWQEMTGKNIITGYGLTEASPVVTINPLTASQFTNSIGLPIPSTEITILDETGQSVAIGQAGELCVKGPQVMQGYWQRPEETQAVLSQKGWLRTGDIVVMDDHGFVYLIDRKKDMILVSGFNVYPIEIENVLASHAGVAEVAVVGVASTQTGEAVKAFIVKKDAALTQEELLQYCKKNLTGYKVPKFIEFRKTLPKSTVGKILKRELRENTV